MNNDSDNMGFSDNYDDDGFFNDDHSKSNQKQSIQHAKEQPSLVNKVEPSNNEMGESINDEYDDVDWGEKKSSIESKDDQVKVQPKPFEKL